MQRRREKLVILCHELAVIRTITDALARNFDLVWTRDTKSCADATGEETAPLAVLADNAAVPSRAIEFLQSVRTARSSVKRILITDYCDLGIIVQGLHTGAVQQIVYKPVSVPELLAAVGEPMVHAAFHSHIAPPASRAVG